MTTLGPTQGRKSATSWPSTPEPGEGGPASPSGPGTAPVPLAGLDVGEKGLSWYAGGVEWRERWSHGSLLLLAQLRGPSRPIISFLRHSLLVN